MGQFVYNTSRLQRQKSYTIQTIAIIVLMAVGMTLGKNSSKIQLSATGLGLAVLDGAVKDTTIPPLTIEQQKEMVFVEGGTFFMGSNEGAPNEKPVHKVTVASFMIGKYEVPYDLKTSVWKDNPKSAYENSLEAPINNFLHVFEFCNRLSEQEGLAPAYKFQKKIIKMNVKSKKNEFVWEVTCDFNSNGYRLPTEAEWEFAARGGNKSKGYIYSGSNNIDAVAWYRDNTDPSVFFVAGMKQPNELGIYDMSGGEYEICWDFEGNYSSSSQKDPKGPLNGENRVIRGGSYMDSAENCTVTHRRGDNPGRMFAWPIGYRLVRSK